MKNVKPFGRESLLEVWRSANKRWLLCFAFIGSWLVITIFLFMGNIELVKLPFSNGVYWLFEEIPLGISCLPAIGMLLLAIFMLMLAAMLLVMAYFMFKLYFFSIGHIWNLKK